MQTYMTGETAAIGDRVSHYADSDQGNVVALDSDGRSVTVVWDKDGQQDHYADECRLIGRADDIRSSYSEAGLWYCRTHAGELCGPYDSEAAMRADFS